MPATEQPPVHVFSGTDLDALYVQAVETVRDSGTEIEKNGKRIKEIFPAVFVLDDPHTGILCVEHRPYNPAFLVAETLWNLTGDSADWLTLYNAKYAKFFSDGELRAGYGYRLFHWEGSPGRELNQIELIVQRLIDESVSQHGSATIFHPGYDLQNPPFVPCITRLQFKVRPDSLGKEHLYMSSYLRAQDIWLGFPYDVHLLLSLFHFVGLKLKLPLGRYYHYCDVLRLYQANYEAAEAPLRASESQRSRKIDFSGLGEDVPGRLGAYRDCLRDFSRCDDRFIDQQPPYWRDSLRICRAYRAVRDGNFALALGQVEQVENALRDQFWIWASTFQKSLLKPNQ
ncbi:MAG TPA: thymidylate synthase [Thermoanaerobaculia bacterium]|nr:thymidylate synthase [Thermoanaerobaculia bacterium]